MRLLWKRVEYPLKTPFTISRGTLHRQSCVVVYFAHDGLYGFGEVACNPYYGHTYDSLEHSLQRIADGIADLELSHPNDLYDICRQIVPNDPFALSAVDAAAYDLYGKVHGIPTTAILGLEPKAVIQSSLSLGIDSLEATMRKYREQPHWPAYKLKLGTPYNLETVRALCQETDATICVDANGAWTPEQTIDYSHEFAQLKVAFIEQPLPADARRADHQMVYEKCPIPVIADESCQTEGDVEKCHGVFHGICVKLCKCGGLTPARRMLLRARELGMKTMVGCMIQSTIGISAAAQLLPLLDYADLDGATHLAKASTSGVRVHNGRVIFCKISGNGIQSIV